MMLSFVLPFYGSVSLLKRCLESFAAQTNGDFEVIVVDDGSPEDGEAVTRSFGERFRYVRQPVNLSAFQARRRGVLEARGDYIVPADPDDYVLPDLVAELHRNLNLLPQSPPDILIYNVEQDTAGVITPHWCHYKAGQMTPDEALQKMADKRLQWNIWSKAIRRDVWLKTLEHMPSSSTARVNISEDFCITVPLVLSSRTIRVIDFVGYRYWQNPASLCNGVTVSKARRAIGDTLRARRMVLAFAAAIGASRSDRACIRKMAAMILSWWVREAIKTILHGVDRM